MQRAPLRRLLLSVQALLPSARDAGVRALTAQPDLDLGVNLKSAAKTAEVLRPVMTLGEELLSQAAQTPAAPAEWRDLQQQQQQTSGAKKTFYKRKLPCPPATEFSSEEGVSCTCRHAAHTGFGGGGGGLGAHGSLPTCALRGSTLFHIDAYI